MPEKRINDKPYWVDDKLFEAFQEIRGEKLTEIFPEQLQRMAALCTTPGQDREFYIYAMAWLRLPFKAIVDYKACPAEARVEIQKLAAACNQRFRHVYAHLKEASAMYH